MNLDDLALTHETQDWNRPGCPMHLWLLRGPHGVVQFKYSRHQAEPGTCGACATYPSVSAIDPAGDCWQAWDLGYHSPVPRYEGHRPIDDGTTPCDILLMEAHCYYDGTGLGAGEVLRSWWVHGSSEAWLKAKLAEYYTVWLVDEGPAFASPVTALISALGGDES